MVLKECLMEDIHQQLMGYGGGEGAIAFSGGTDSLCILFSCLELGFTPSLYTYYVEGYPSKDLEFATRVADHYKLNLITVQMPSDLETLKRDVIRLIHDFGVKGKVNIQCCHGHMYVAPLVKEKIILNGSGVDGIYGTYREFFYDGCKDCKRTFDKKRLKHLANRNDDAMQDQKGIYSHHGVKVIFPYRTKPIIDFLMEKTWMEINTPRFKEIIVKEFKQFEEFSWLYRPRGSQQIMAGVRDLHEKLKDSSLNFNDRTRLRWIYSDIEKSFERNGNPYFKKHRF